MTDSNENNKKGNVIDLWDRKVVEEKAHVPATPFAESIHNQAVRAAKQKAQRLLDNADVIRQYNLVTTKKKDTKK
jgi:hypothetical protein